MSHQETLEEFQTRFSSQFSAEQQKVLFKKMLEEQITSTSTSKTSKTSSEICPSTPPPTQQTKRSLQSPITPYHGGSRKVLILIQDYSLTLDDSS
jgi:2-phospho-L-lactate guanylyltransferase (CobY/MobA/RfbA family)